MATRRTKFNGWPSWRYGPNGESGIFQSPSDVPFGWTSKPGQVFSPLDAKPALDRDKLISDLLAKGIEPHPAWGIGHMKKVLDDGSSTR